MGDVTYSYSVERAEFALLNADGSYPSPKDWTHTPRKGGAAVTHKGGLIAGTGPWNFTGLAGADLQLTPVYGNAVLAPITVSLAAAGNIAAVTATELAAALNAAFTAGDVDATASVTSVGADYDAAYLKIVDSGSLPWYAPFGFGGLLAEIAGFVGWKATKNLKSSNAEPNTETGDTVTATSGAGNMCSIKEPDTVTGKKLTITLAASEEDILSMIFGDDFDPDTGLYFERGSGAVSPMFAFRVWVSRYASGENVKANQSKMMVRTFPACTGTPGSSNDEEATFATVEISADVAANSDSNVPSEFRQLLTVTDYKNNVSAA